jgi:predicted DNA-binding WGR domain protein
MKTYLEFIDDTSNKFWEIESKDREFLAVRFGKIGTTGTLQSKQYSDISELFGDYRKQITAKMNKGYIYGAAEMPGSAGAIMSAFRDLGKISGIEIDNHCSKILIPDNELIDSDFKTIQEEVGIALPEEFRNQYFSAEYLSYAWRHDDENGGEISLSGPEQAVVFNYIEPEGLYGSKAEEMDIDFIKSLRYFDGHPHTGDGFMVFFRLEKDKKNLELYIDRNAYGEFEKLDITYEQYLKHSEKLLGLYRWQCLYTDNGLEDSDDLFESGLEALEKAFPQNDYSEYRNLL